MKIAIFYHIYQLTHHPNLSKEYWIKMYNSQIDALKESDLYHACDFVQLGINGSDLVDNFSDKIKVSYNSPSDKGESGTLKMIKEFCLKEENQDYKILYFHQKHLYSTTYLHSCLLPLNQVIQCLHLYLVFLMLLINHQYP